MPCGTAGVRPSSAVTVARTFSERLPLQSAPASQTICLPVPGRTPAPMSPVTLAAGTGAPLSVSVTVTDSRSPSVSAASYRMSTSREPPPRCSARTFDTTGSPARQAAAPNMIAAQKTVRRIVTSALSVPSITQTCGGGEGFFSKESRELKESKDSIESIPSILSILSLPSPLYRTVAPKPLSCPAKSGNDSFRISA
ncbi:MAG: hypothetical protein BWX70_03195 [Verrucomicrobia bacterium ADurb.Bin070]|nr:MAG: hypothetical protein BWX70_03195 [Verrucomicrobia bacterium ADurb.Bin070]